MRGKIKEILKLQSGNGKGDMDLSTINKNVYEAILALKASSLFGNYQQTNPSSAESITHSNPQSELDILDIISNAVDPKHLDTQSLIRSFDSNMNIQVILSGQSVEIQQVLMDEDSLTKALVYAHENNYNLALCAIVFNLSKLGRLPEEYILRLNTSRNEDENHSDDDDLNLEGWEEIPEV